jgi:hypothetical protein
MNASIPVADHGRIGDAPHGSDIRCQNRELQVLVPVRDHAEPRHLGPGSRRCVYGDLGNFHRLDLVGHRRKRRIHHDRNLVEIKIGICDLHPDALARVVGTPATNAQDTVCFGSLVSLNAFFDIGKSRVCLANLENAGLHTGILADPLNLLDNSGSFQARGDKEGVLDACFLALDPCHLNSAPADQLVSDIGPDEMKGKLPDLFVIRESVVLECVHGLLLCV